MVAYVLVAIGHHRSSAVPATTADDVHRLGQERVGVAHDRADVEVVLPVLDRDVERVPHRVEVGHDRIDAPVPVAIDHIAAIADREQLGIETIIVGPRQRMGAHPDVVEARGVVAHRP